MSNRTVQRMVSVSQIVLPITMIVSLLSIAFWGGTEHERLNYVQSRQDKVIITLENLVLVVQDMRMDLQKNRLMLEQASLDRKEIMDKIRKAQGAVGHP